jgi:outer membrane protein assembly factor BamB
LLWRAKLPGVADSSPILRHDLDFPEGTRDVLYATTRNGAITALDAASGEILWSHHPSGPQITTSSPVTDPSGRFVYSYGLDGRVHKYAAITGDEHKGGGWPVTITLMPETEKGSSALNIANGRIYATTSGYIGDAPPYQGHVVAIDEASGAEEIFNSLCSDQVHLLSAEECPSERSGIWARGGAVVDPATDSVFATTGNGPYDANSSGGHDYGDSILKLDPESLRLIDSYTPVTYRRLEEVDADLGSTAPALLPKVPESKTPLLLVQGGKDGLLRLVDRQNLSGAGEPGRVGGQLQTIKSAGCATFTQPVVWTHDEQTRVIVAGTCGIAAYLVSTDSGGTTRLRLAWRTSDETTTSVLAGGVLFAATDGAVLALDPSTGERLWSSDRESAGGSIGDIHWESPIVINGRLYVSDESGAMTAYGLPGDQ